MAIGIKENLFIRNTDKLHASITWFEYKLELKTIFWYSVK
jgi:hypothetical protein